MGKRASDRDDCLFHLGVASKIIDAQDDGNLDAYLSQDLLKPPEDFETRKLGDKIENAWRNELGEQKQGRASLSRALFKAFAFDWSRQVLCGLILVNIPLILMLEFARRFLHTFLAVNKGHTEEPNVELSSSNRQQLDDRSLSLELTVLQSKALTLSGIVISLGIYFVGTAITRQIGIRNGLRCRSALTCIVQRKSVRLHPTKRQELTGSAAAMLVSSEITFVDEANRLFAYLIMGPICSLSVMVWLTATQVSWLTAFSPVPLITIANLFQFYLIGARKRLNMARSRETAGRLETINTFLSAIKVFKMYSWEWILRNKVDLIRDEELEVVRKIDWFTLYDGMATLILNRLFISSTALTSIYLGEFNAITLFTVGIAHFFSGKDSTLTFIESVRSTEDLLAACDRIKQFLLLDEIHDPRLVIGMTPSNGKQIVCENATIALELTNSSLPYGRQKLRSSEVKQIVAGLTATFREGELTLVVGQVGAGKSSLLLGLLGEAHIAAGKVAVSAATKFAYAAQEPWILPASLRENILMNRPLEIDRYNELLRLCALSEDINLLPDGDATLVGARGVTLSGGQRARVALARAIYSDADVYLLDDPLSAVDMRVARHIFDHCIRGYLRHKLVVLATHQLQFLDRADKVIVLEMGKQPIVGGGAEVAGKNELRRILAEPKLEATAKIGAPSTLATSRIPEQDLVKSKEQPPSSSVYLFILKLGFSPLSLSLLFTCFLALTPVIGLRDYYYRIWSSHAIEDSEKPELSERDRFVRLLDDWLIQTLLLAASSCLLWNFLKQLNKGLNESSRGLHIKLMDALFNARMSFYDRCQMGELTSRYAAAFAIVDQLLSKTVIRMTFSTMVFFSSNLILILISPAYVVALFAVYAAIYTIAQPKFRKLRRIRILSDSLLVHPLTALATLVEDPSSIRSDPDYAKSAVDKFTNSNDRFNSVALAVTSWEFYLYFALNLSLVLLLGSIWAVAFLQFGQDMDLSAAGTFLALTLNAAHCMPIILDHSVMLETSIVAVERVREFISIEPEEPSKRLEPSSLLVDKIKWPRGQISFEAVTLSYWPDGRRPVLEGLSFEIAGGERVGIVGRTGAGKSSLISLLFRLYPFEGKVSIDGLDTSTLALATLRASLAVIPQDPILFRDSLRRNLDPFGWYSDEQLWAALDLVGLRGHLAAKPLEGLECQVGEFGRNFSLGQRQLVCLARAVLKEPKILIIDEATASVDPKTDSLIQATIKRCFEGSTVLNIAHRLSTVLDYDRIMVLEAGRLVEFDTVERLLALEGGHFRAMWEDFQARGAEQEAEDVRL